MQSIERLDDELILDALPEFETRAARPRRSRESGATRAEQPRALLAERRLQMGSRRRLTAMIAGLRHVRTAVPMMIVDGAALALAGTGAALIMRLSGSNRVTIPVAAVAMLPMIVAYLLGGLYGSIGTHPAMELRHLFQLTTVGMLAASIGGAFAGPPVAWCGLAWCGALVLVPIVRSVARNRFARQSWWTQPAIVIASAGAANEVVDVLRRCPSAGLRPVAIADCAAGMGHDFLPVIADEAECRRIVGEQVIRYGVISLPDAGHEQLARIVEQYGSFIPHLLVLSDASTLPNLGTPSRACGRLGGMEFSNLRMLTAPRILKRALDVSIGCVVLVVCLPLMLLIAALVKATSRGPVFFGHGRIGLDGRPFEAWKFRTMRTDGDRVLREKLQSDPVSRLEWERDHKLRDDPRVTRIGWFLRKSSFDELPQVWNVLKGNMSLVGPRPIVTSEIWRYGDRFKLYTAVKPGITGLWQVSGRSETSYAERVRFDEYYVRNWSPWLDVYIIARTAPSLLKSTGAY